MRQALSDADAIPFPVPITIDFNIPTSDPDYVPGGNGGYYLMQPVTPLPVVTRPDLTVDGRSQVAFDGDTNPNPEIVLDGQDLTVGSGLQLNAGNNVIDGLDIERFLGYGIYINGTSNNWIYGNYIGTDPTGTVAEGNANGGIYVVNGGNNLIGTNGDGVNDAAERNVISGNGNNGVYINGLPYYDDTLATVDQMIDGTLPTTQATGTIAQADLIDASDPPNGYTPPSWTYDNPIPGGGGEYYAFNAPGTFYVTTAGTYSFALGSDDGSRLTVDGNLVGEFDGGRGFGVTYATTYLTAGTHTFDWVGFQEGGQAGFELSLAAGTNTSTVSTANGWYVLGDPAAPIQLLNPMTVRVYYINAANTIAGNYIGTNAAGTAALANAQTGVYVLNSRGNVIGTTNGSADVAAEENVISGNGQWGVRLQISFSNSVAGNLIGTYAAGAAAIGNGISGILIHNNSTENVVSNNVISGNDGYGIDIQDSGTIFNTVAGNYVGTNAAGTGPVGNGNVGIWIGNGASDNLIGASGSSALADAAARNVISGNGWDGVQLNGVGTDNNVVAGNYIGVDVTGMVAMHDGASAISIFNGASDNRIGTDGNEADNAGERNLIDADSDGVFICDSDTTGNLVAGNYIGLTAAGTTASGVGNSTGVYDQAADNTIGGTTAVMANVIAGNTTYDIELGGGNLADGESGTFNAAGNVIEGDFIGTDPTGTTSLSGANTRVYVSGGTTNSLLNNTYGGTGGYAIQVVGGTEVSVSGNVTGNVTDSGTLDLTGNVALVGAFTGTGAVTNSLAGGTATLTVNGTGTYYGVIEDGATASTALTVAGGTVTLGGANTYTGATTILAGTLQLAAAPTLPAPVVDYTFGAGAVNGSTVTNLGTSGTAENATLIGGATVASSNGGPSSEALSIPSQSAYLAIDTIGGKGVNLSGGNWTASAWVDDLYPDSTWRTLFRGATGDHQVITEAGTNTLGSYMTSGAGFVSSGYNVTPILTGWHNITAVGIDGTTEMYVDGVLVGTVPTESLTDIYAIGNYQGTGQAFAQLIDDVSIYQTALSAAQVGLLVTGTAPSGTLSSATKVSISSGATFDLNGNNASIGALSGSGVVTSSTGASVNLTVNGTGTFSGIIQNGGTNAIVALTIAGGTVTLSGANTYTGGTTITAGLLSISSDSNVGADPASATPGNLVLNGGTLQATASFTLNSNRGIALGPTSGSGGGTIDVTSGSTLTYGGIVANNGGTGSLTLADSGTLILSATNTYTGATTIDAGTLAVDGSITSAATVNSGGTLTGGGTINANVTNNGGTVSTAYSGADVLADQPAAYYQLAETSGTTAVDSSEHNLNGTYQGGYTLNQPGPVPGIPAVALDGMSGNVSVPAGAVNNLTSGTIAAWVYLNNNTGETIFAKQHNGVNSEAIFTIGYLPTGGPNPGTAGTMYFHAENSTPTAASTGTVSTGAWHYVAVVFSSTAVTFYIDGVASGTTSGDYHIPNDTNPTSTNIGAWVENGNPDLYALNGSIAQFAVFGTALSAAQINAIYHGTLTVSGSYTQSSGTTSLSGTLAVSGAATFNGGSLAGAGTFADNGSLTFNSAGSFTVTPVISGAGSLTEEGSGTLVLTGANTYSGGTNAMGPGILTLANNTAAGTGAIVVTSTTGGTGVTGTRVALQGGITVSNSLSLSSNSNGDIRTILFVNSGNNTWSGPITLSGADRISFAGNAGTVLNIAGGISGPSFTGILFAARGTAGFTTIISSIIDLPNATALAGGTLQVTDGATLIVSSTGNTVPTVGAVFGTIQLGANNALPTGVSLMLGQNSAGADSGTLDLAGFNQQVSTLTVAAGAVPSDETVMDSGGPATLTITAGGTFSGNITGVNTALTVGGGNQTLTLSGDNTYGGPTTINSGILSISSDSNLVPSRPPRRRTSSSAAARCRRPPTTSRSTSTAALACPAPRLSTRTRRARH